MPNEPKPDRSAVTRPDTQLDRQHEAALARDYAQAAKGDAWHQRASDSPAGAPDEDATLVASQDESAPSTEASRRTRKATSHGPGSGPVWDAERGRVSEDALKRGLEPGEMGSEDNLRR